MRFLLILVLLFGLFSSVSYGQELMVTLKKTGSYYYLILKKPESSIQKKELARAKYSRGSYEGASKPCFTLTEIITYDANQFAGFFKYDGKGDCINEVYSTKTSPNNLLFGVLGLSNHGAIGRLPYYSGKFFAVIFGPNTETISIKQASETGVVTSNYNVATEVVNLSSVVNQRLAAIKEREEAKGNKVETTPDPSSVKDKKGPMIDIPGKLIAENDSIIIEGKVTDESDIASFKIDGKSLQLKEDGSFEQSLYVEPDGIRVTIEAIDKFNNKTTREITIVRKSKSESTSTAKLPSLNPTTIDGKTNPDAIALIIGITNYRNSPISIYSDRDAKLFSDYAYRALGVPRIKTKLLIEDSASLIEIKKALKRWMAVEIKANKTDVYLFFSGHGLVSNNKKDLFLLPYDGDPDLLEDSSLKRSELFKLIETNKPRSITAFLDTCYSGLTRGNEMLVANARPVMIVSDESNISPNITLFSASANNEIASGFNETKHGLFSYYMMKGLEGDADSNGDKKITTGELHAFLSTNVKKQAQRLGRKQTPQLSGDPDKVLVRW